MLEWTEESVRCVVQIIDRVPDVPEADFLVEVSAHDALLCADDVVTAGAGEHRLHTWHWDETLDPVNSHRAQCQ